MLVCACGSTKVENRDRGECATCNRARRKAESTPPPKKRAPLRQVSAKMAERNASKYKAYEIVDAREPRCVTCGGTYNLTHSHVLPQGRVQGQADNPDNILLECGRCHDEWQDDKYLAMQTHRSWAMKMEIMERLEPAYFAEFKMKNPALFNE